MFALVSFAPAAQAQSSNGTITISPTSGTPSYACADGICDFATLVTVTGTGFPSGQDSIDICFLTSSDTVTAGCPTGGIDLGSNAVDALFDQSISGSTADTVQADANGNFEVQFYAPIAYGGTYNVYAYYTPSSGVPVNTAAVTFTLKAAMAVEDQDTLANSGIPGQPFDVIVVGMGAASSAVGEGIQLIPSSFFSGSWTGLTVGHTLGVDQGVFEEDDGAVVTGSATSIGSGTLATLPSGTSTVEALGLTTGTTTSTTFTTTPSIILTAYSTGCPGTTAIISTSTAAGSKFCMSGTGFAKSSTLAAAGSVTVGGASTIESAITTSSSGTFGPIAVTLSSSTSVGPLTIAFGGMDFNFSNGNIQGAGVLLGSNLGQGALTSVQDAYTLSTSGNIGDTVYVFGFGYSAGTTVAFDWEGGNVANVPLGLTTVSALDGNGAFMVEFSVPTDPTTNAACASGSYTCWQVVDTSTGTTNTAPTQTFTILPEASFGGSINFVPNYNSFGFHQTLTVDGFASTDSTLTVTMNGVTWATVTYAPGVPGGSQTFNLPVIGSTQSIDFAGGSYSINASGTTSGNWAVTTNTLTILPIQAESEGVGAISALSVNSGNAGTSIAVLSATSGGIHGLAPNTAYTVMWDGTDEVASFTSTSSGEVPIGVSFNVPEGTSGLHIVDIQSAGVSALYGDQLTGGQQFGGCGNTCDLIFDLLPVLTATPSLVGATQTATVVGSGLPSNSVLYIVGPNSVSYASFTSTATGSVPSGITFTVPTQPTYTTGCHAGNTCAGGELGTLITWSIENSAGHVVGELQYVYGTTATLSASSGAAGTSVTITVNGLNAPAGGNVFSSDSPYSIVFNCIPNEFAVDECAGTATGATPANIVIGALIPNTLGEASTTITIPASATAGTYVLQIVGSNSRWDLALPLSFTVGGAVTGQMFTISGTPSQVTLGGQPYLTATYSNPTSSEITGIVELSVQNALGQTVLITTSTINPAGGASATAYLYLGLLPSGTYTASVFVLSTGGGSLSAPTSVSSFTVS
jgi:hypothetical protein